ncbi:trp operon repressor [Endozoicomonas sp. Mp262]|uniref:trp operon repressor n=1 Tax=Endozoicomonas sp. Mp262 TaxID=2919499 RepID=UPI0021E0F4E3
MTEGSWKEFLELLERRQNAGDLENILNVLLTPEECEAIGNRLATLRALLAGNESQREIAARLGVSIAKVTRCSNNLKQLSSSEKAIIQ